MRQQQLLEEEIKQYTAALFEANLRLETEMRERALAQQELNLQNDRMEQELTLTLDPRHQPGQDGGDAAKLRRFEGHFRVVAGMAPKVFSELRGAVLMLNSSRGLAGGGCVLVRLPASRGFVCPRRLLGPAHRAHAHRGTERSELSTSKSLIPALSRKR